MFPQLKTPRPQKSPPLPKLPEMLRHRRRQKAWIPENQRPAARQNLKTLRPPTFRQPLPMRLLCLLHRQTKRSLRLHPVPSHPHRHLLPPKPDNRDKRLLLRQPKKLER